MNSRGCRRRLFQQRGCIALVAVWACLLAASGLRADPPPHSVMPSDSQSVKPSASQPQAVAELPAAAESQTAAVPLRARGQTMGTAYAVTLHHPAIGVPADWPAQVDRELRLVNDQMSTYIETSELSLFNQSTSEDWFPVSAETALVVGKAIEVYELSGGAFDVTVGELVNLWSFGPEPRRFQPPSEQQIQQAMVWVGSDQLQVRQSPPALRKQVAALQVDLSAIAKGHGVDRVIDLLKGLGVENAFVEIGGEVRAIGQKAGAADWVVGIQKPDRQGQRVDFAVPLHDQAIATSGDYRNFFEYQGKRYSHTIDPRSGRPIEHDLASVTVLADDCMTADALATAFTVLGVERGTKLAEQLGVTVLMISREPDGFSVSGTGSLKP